jgi:hypothetical protein
MRNEVRTAQAATRFTPQFGTHQNLSPSDGSGVIGICVVLRLYQLAINAQYMPSPVLQEDRILTL